MFIRPIPEAGRRAYEISGLEAVYLARADSAFGDRSVYELRRDLGGALAEEFAELASRVDVVVPVPETADPAARELAQRWGKRCGGIQKNRPVRSFLQPDPESREAAARSKYAVIAGCLRGCSVALVDDTIVRGTTMARLIAELRRAGAREVHVLITYPPIRHPCSYGIDIPRPEDLIARRAGDPDGLRAAIGADSLHMLSPDAVRRALGALGPLCLGCADGHYADRPEAVEVAPPAPDDDPGAASPDRSALALCPRCEMSPPEQPVPSGSKLW